MSKPSRHDVIQAFADCKLLLQRYIELATDAEASRLVGVLPAVRELQSKFEEATSPYADCTCDAPEHASKMHQSDCPAAAKLDLGKFLRGGRAAQQAVDDAIAAHGRSPGGAARKGSSRT